MRQKYIIERNEENGGYIIKELAEVDKEMFSLLCSESFDADAINEAINDGTESLVAKIRTKNMYPPMLFAQKIAEALIDLDHSEDQHSVEIMFDDKELLALEKDEETEDLIDDTTEIDDLLEDEDVNNQEQEIDGDDDLKNLTSTLKVSEDDSIATDEE
jgi:hypothetical protein